MRVVSRVREAFGVELPVRTLFERPTVEGLAALVEERLRDGGRARAPRLVRAERAGPQPLSFAQERLWFLDQLEPGSSQYNMNGTAAVRLTGRLDAAAMERALNEAVARHDVLRTTFQMTGDGPVQVVSPSLALKLAVEDLSHTEREWREAEARRQALAEAQKPFDLARGPLVRARLLRLAEDEHVLLLNVHHIVSDGWSTGVLAREVAAAYEAFAAGAESPLPPLPAQYSDFVAWQRGWLQGEALEEQLSYWREKLAGAPPVLELPTDRPRPAVQTFRGAKEPLTISPELAGQLRARGREQGATLFMTLLAAFQTLLSRYSRQDEVVVGSPVAGRTLPEVEPLIGLFASTLVLRTSLKGDPTFAQLLARVRETTLEAYAHQDLPFEKLVEELKPARDLSRNPLFQTMLVFQSVADGDLKFSTLGVEPLEVDAGVSRFDLLLNVTEAGGGLKGFLEYNTDLFEPATVRRMLGHFHTLLAAVAVRTDARLSGLPLLTESERRQLEAWNETARDFGGETTLAEMFEAQAAATPDAVAVVFGDERLSYRELGRRADLLARRLRSLGVGPDVLVGVCMERSVEMAVAVLGVIKSGGAYAPLDPTYPRERLAFMLEDTRTPALLTQTRLVAGLPPHGAQVLCLDAGWGAGVEEENDAAGAALIPSSGENLTYVIYTSGSTGRPKGVALPQRALVNLIRWHNSELVGGAPTLQFASLSFDVSFLEMFAAWASGGALHVISKELRQDVAALSKYLLERRVEKAILPVIVLQQLAEDYTAARDLDCRLREVITTGEQMQVTPPVVELFRRLKGCALHNHYGPSESHVVTAYTLAGEPGGWEKYPSIGRPVANTAIRLLDAHLNPAPVGVAGELYIAGVNLARGYLARPALTAERFVPDPFAREPGARLYRTGDLARYRPDGNIEYLGRMDHQVKIRGFRVEPGEVEAALSAHPSVRELCVVVREDAPGEKRLVAYVACDPSETPTTSDLFNFLKAKLPEYMTPSAFVLLDELPLTPNGKVDRRALPAPAQTRPELAEQFVAPRTPAEEVVAGIFAAVLDLRAVGVRDNFFELGGHSLLATRVVARVKDSFRTDLPLRAVFQTPTVEGLVAALAEAWGEREIVEEIARTTLYVQQLSEEEVRSALSVEP
jgi:amino acid adenylation domain-containing protein